MTKQQTPAITNPFVRERTDEYFAKSKAVVNNFGEMMVQYEIFQRREVLCAPHHTIDFIKKYCPEAEIIQHFEEGAIIPAQSKQLTVKVPFTKFVELETQALQRIGFCQVAAYNAYHMALALPNIPFLDMHARHSVGDDMVTAASYGASVGSRTARLQGAKGFVATSNQMSAHYFPVKQARGSMPHALIGYAGIISDREGNSVNKTLRATQMYCETHPEEENVIVLVDYDGKEISDSIECAKWFYDQPENRGKTFAVRLDTHGGRFSEGLDYEKSVKVVCDWLNVSPADEYSAVREALGDEVFNMAGDENIDKIRKLLFGQGVSAANIIDLRNNLNVAGLTDVGIVASSGFNLFKCQIMAKVKAPIDIVGTGSYLPNTFSETYATADIVKYDGEASIKVGREWLLK